MAFGWTPANVELTINGTRIPQTDVMRVLGIYFDPRMTWKAHVDHVVRSSNQHMRWFRRLTWTPGLKRGWRRTAYLALNQVAHRIRQRGVFALSNRQLKRLIVLQNNCLRAILNVRLSDRVAISELERPELEFNRVPAYYEKSQRRYICKAVEYILPIREDVEAVRNNPSPPQRSPIFKTNLLLPVGPLPPPA